MSILLTCMSVYHLHALCREISEEGVTYSELELWSVVDYHMGAENHNWVLSKNKYTKLMSHLSKPVTASFINGSDNDGKQNTSE